MKKSLKTRFKFARIALGAARKTFDRRYTNLINPPELYDRDDKPPDVDIGMYKDIIANSPLVWACIDRIANALIELPMIFKQGTRKNAVELEDHPLISLFHRPNPFDTYRQLFYGLIYEFYNGGEAYLIGDRTLPDTGPQELWHLPSDEVEVVTDPKEFVKGFKVKRFAKSIFYDYNEVIWFKSYNPKNPWRGFSRMTPLMRVLLGILHSYKHNLEYFKAGTSMGPVIEAEGEFDEADYNRTIKSLRKRHRRPHEPEILYKMHLKETGKSPKDVDFKNFIELLREDVVSTFGNPPAVMGFFNRANYANALIQLKMFWLIAVMPIKNEIESVINWNYIERWYPGQKIWMEFDTSGVEALQADKLRQAQVDQIYVQSGIYEANEIRVSHGDSEHSDGYGLRNRFDLTAPPNNSESAANEKSIKSLRFKASDDRGEAWQSKDDARLVFEKKYYKLMRQYFIAQGKRVLNKLNNFSDEAKPNIGQLYDSKEEKEALKALSLPVFIDVLANSGKLAIDEVNQLGGKAFRKLRQTGLRQYKAEDDTIAVSFNYTDPDILEWINQHSGVAITQIDDVTLSKIQAILEAGYAEGRTLKEIANDISNLYGDQFTVGRAMTIARTETGSAFNKGILEGYKQAPDDVEKDWLATPDEVTRPDHWEAGLADPIPVDEKFIVGGEYLDHPGDPAGSVEQIANCRCTMRARLKDKG